LSTGFAKVGTILVCEHIDNCIKDAIEEGKGEEAVESLSKAIKLSMDM